MTRKDWAWVLIILLGMLLLCVLIIYATNKEGMKCISNPFIYTEQSNGVILLCTYQPLNNNSNIPSWSVLHPNFCNNLDDNASLPNKNTPLINGTVDYFPNQH